MKKLSFAELENKTDWREAVLVFSPSSFDQEYSEIERSYKVSRSEKYFNPILNGSSLFGDCLDGTDDNVRLDLLDWEIEYCYIIK